MYRLVFVPKGVIGLICFCVSSSLHNPQFNKNTFADTFDEELVGTYYIEREKTNILKVFDNEKRLILSTI